MPTTYAIPNGRTVMDSTLYTGDGTTSRSIVNSDTGTIGFEPDFVWLKQRNTGLAHALYDNVRGVGSGTKLSSNDTAGEGGNDNSTYGYVSAINSNGFSIVRGSDGTISYTNVNNGTYVAWQWNAGTTTTNNVGSISSQVSANTTAGFSIVTFTVTAVGTSDTIGHGLTAVPQLIITKSRNNAFNWATYHVSLGNTQRILLNTTDAAASTSAWNNTTPTSSVFSVGSSIYGNGNMVAYCWAPVAGFSQFGSYTGNGSTDGPFIYTGFRPAFVLRKSSTLAYSWYINDTAENPSNVIKDFLAANTSDAQVLNDTNYAVDILSNGFKVRSSHITQNNNGDTYIYMAFAENPFKYSNAR